MKTLQRQLNHQQPSVAGRVTATLGADQVVLPFGFKSSQPRPLYQQVDRNLCGQSARITPRVSSLARRVPRTTDSGCSRASRCDLHTKRDSPIQPRSIDSFSSQAAKATEPKVHNVFEPVTGTWQYVVADEATDKAVIIDPVLNFDPVSQAITTSSADGLMALVNEHGYHIEYILETHAHADHLTAASYLQSRLARQQGRKPPIGIGKRIVQVQKLFGQRYEVPAEEYGVVFDKLLDDDEIFEIGNLKGAAIHLPGHTPDHMGYVIGDNVFCGDSIFHADIGTARCDFPGGSASDLYRSGRKLLCLPGYVKIWTGHDYPPADRRDPVAYLTVDEHREQNKHLSDAVSEDEYVAMRKARDAQMGEPRLLHQSLQVNIRGGQMPKPTEASLRLLHLPLKLKAVEGWNLGADSAQVT